MSEPDQEFKFVLVHDVEQHAREGWRFADAWKEARHHLRYAVPMVRDLPEAMKAVSPGIRGRTC